MFYNVENFFDVYDEINKSDEAYLPSSMRHWTNKRYQNKLSNFARVLCSVSEPDFPVIVGLAEIENITVLNDVVNHSSLVLANYSFLHKESPDSRGIDVALLYKGDRFKPLHTEFIPVCLSKKWGNYTRDILYCKGVLNEVDTLHVFVNHWSSRCGGKRKTQWKRVVASKILSLRIGSILDLNLNAKIIVMGDFNDGPKEVSIKKFLCEKKGLINKALIHRGSSFGTLKYKFRFYLFDQIIVSSSVESSNMHIIKYPFLLEEDIKYGGFKPKRTYKGMRYNGGFSDHLPVYIDLYCQ